MKGVSSSERQKLIYKCNWRIFNKPLARPKCLEELYNEYGYYEIVKFVFNSEREFYLKSTRDVSKTIELASLSKGERSIVKYLNYLEGKKASIVPSLSINIYNNTKDSKMTPRQIKSMKAKVKKLPKSQQLFLSTFIGVLELDRDKLQAKSLRTKLSKIKALYESIIPSNNIDFNNVVLILNSKGIKSSRQDVIAFISLILELSCDGVNVNIPASFWESMFGRDHIKVAKQVFQNKGILKLISKPIPGFKSAGYQINLFDKLNDVENLIDLEITSIKTLEKLNRIKRFKGNFTLKEKVEALKLIIKLRLEEIRGSNIKINLTMLFLESGKIQKLIDDLTMMINIMNDKEFYNKALSLGIHLTGYFNNVKKDANIDYKSWYYGDGN